MFTPFGAPTSAQFFKGFRSDTLFLRQRRTAPNPRLHRKIRLVLRMDQRHLARQPALECNRPTMAPDTPPPSGRILLAHLRNFPLDTTRLLA